MKVCILFFFSKYGKTLKNTYDNRKIIFRNYRKLQKIIYRNFLSDGLGLQVHSNSKEGIYLQFNGSQQFYFL